MEERADIFYQFFQELIKNIFSHIHRSAPFFLLGHTILQTLKYIQHNII